MGRIRLVVLLASAVAVFVTVLGSAGAQVEGLCFGQEPTIERGDANDHVKGTRGNDVIVLGDGDDRVDGRGGRDLICTGEGDDSVNGGRGNDRLDGGLGRDLVFGGSGHDQAIGGPVLFTRWECRGGVWHLVTYDMSSVPARQVDDINTEQPCLEPPPAPVDRANQLDGDALVGGGGRDRLLGGGGNDRGLGGAGNDRLFGHAGNDVLTGGFGSDRVIAGPVLMSRWECRNGTWHLVTYDESVTPPREVDDIDTGSPCLPPTTPAITPFDRDGAAGGPGADRVNGGYGDDTLLGQGGRDRIRGGSGNDRLSGGAGRDDCAQGEDTRSC